MVSYALVRGIQLISQAPEYALDSQLSSANDLYSLGCVLYAVHMGGRPPFVNGASMQSLRDHAEGSLVRKDWMRVNKWDRCSGEVKGMRFSASCCTSSADQIRSPTSSPHPPCLQSSLARFPSFTSILLLARHLHAQLPGSHHLCF